VDEAFAEVRASFDRFCLAAGIDAHDGGACHGGLAGDNRWGRTQGRIGFHGGKIEVERPRA